MTGVQLNCRGVNARLGELKLLIYTKKPDFVALSETFLNSHSKNIPRFMHYVSEWKHRPFRTGGGLGILIRQGIQYQNLQLTPYTNGVLEFQAITIFLNNNQKINILSIYNPNEDLRIGEFRHYISQLGSRYLIIGDFNAHSLILNNRTTATNVTGRTIENIILNDPICLINPINFYTYINTATYKRSCLDLCFSSSNLAHSIALDLLADVGSDHMPISITVQTRPIQCTFVPKKNGKLTQINFVTFLKILNPLLLFSLLLPLS